MRRVSQSGSSLFGSVGLFIVSAIACAIASYWISLARHHTHLNNITVMMADFFSKYQEAVPDLIRQKVDLKGPIYLSEYNLINNCEEAASTFDPNKKVCKLPLGEMDINAKYKAPNLYTYVYVHFTDMYKQNSCKSFLSAQWEKVLPQYWWGVDGYIGVISENTKGKLLFSYNSNYIKNEGAQRTPTPEHINEVCSFCKNSRYCTVMFFFALNENVFKK